MGKLRHPFMVFRGSLPEVEVLLDPNATPEEKARARMARNDSIDVVKSFAERNTQRGRHKEDHAKRDLIMAGLKRDAHGKPVRGEPARLATLHNVSRRTVEKWIEQLSKSPTRSAEAVRADSRAVYYGKMLRHQSSVAGRQRKKRAR